MSVSVSVCVCLGLGGWPLSSRCVTSAAPLSPANGALVGPCEESPAEALLLVLMLDQHQRKLGRMTTVGAPSTHCSCREKEDLEGEKHHWCEFRVG